MKSFFSRSRYQLVSHLTLWTSLTQVLPVQVYAEKNTASLAKDSSENDEAKYTVNFNDTSVIEVIRFVSKITGANFVFKESDLQFNVTIISEEPISARNFTSALIQVLRVNGLTLLEQEGNFLITISDSGVNQIPTIISGELPGSLQTDAPLVTRVFRIKNADINSVAGIVKPLTSQSSLIEISEQTRQLIITDIATNVDKIAILLLSLDTPHSNLEIESYIAKNVYPPNIITLAEKILAPFKENNPLIFVPQIETNTVFVISTPHLIERALSVMEDVDIPPTAFKVGAEAPQAEQSAHIYKMLNQSADVLLSSLQSITSQFPAETSSKLLKAIQGARHVQNTGSLIFITDEDTWNQLKDILTGLDTPPYFGAAGKPTFWVYKPQNTDAKRLQAALKQMAIGMQDKTLQATISSSRWIQESNSLAFTAPESLLQKLQSIVTSLDTPFESKLQVFTYKIQKASDQDLTSSLHQVADSSQDVDIKEAIRTMKAIAGNHALIFNASPETIRKLQVILQDLDASPTQSLQIFTYKIQKASDQNLVSSLQQVADSSQDRDMKEAIRTMKWIAGSNTFVFNTTAETIRKLQIILQDLDVAHPQQIKLKLYTYKVEKASEAQIHASLEELKRNTQDSDLISAIASAKWIAESHLFIFNGSETAIAQLQLILPTLDVPSNKQEVQFYTYKVQNGQQEKLKSQLLEMAATMQDKPLADAIKSVKDLKDADLLMFSGTPDALAKLRSLLPHLDIAGPAIAPTQFYTYKIQNGSGSTIQASLSKMAETIHDPDFVETIKNMQWIPEANVFVFNGKTSVITQLQGILPSLDIPTIKTDLFSYKIQTATASKLLESLKEFAKTSKDPDFIQTVQDAKWMQESNVLVFNGKTAVITQLQSILPILDTPSIKTDLFSYKIQTASASKILESLKEFATTSKDTDFIRTVQEAQWIQESNVLLFNGTPAILARLQSILPTLDMPSVKMELFSYKIQTAPASKLLESLKEFAKNSKDADFIRAVQEAQWMQESNLLVFNGTPAVIARLQSILPTFDMPSVKKELFSYKVQSATALKILESLKEFAKTSKDADFIQTVQEAQWMQESNLLVFNGTPSVIARLQSILPTFDMPTIKMDLFSYKIQYAAAPKILESLKELAKTSKDLNFIQAVQEAQWMQESNTLVFHATPETVTKLQSLLPSIDVNAGANQLTTAPKNQFLIYTPKNQTGEELKKNIEELTHNFKNSGLENSALLEALDSMKWVSSSQSLVFTGNAASLDRIQTILQNLDAQSTQNSAFQVFLYKPIYASQAQLQEALTLYAQSLNHDLVADQVLSQAIYRAQWVPESSSFLFKSDAVTIGRLRGILATLDNPKALANTYTNTFFLYKLQKAPGNIVMQNLKDLADHLPPDDANNQAVIRSLQNLKWVKDNNAILITGSSYAIDQIKALMAQFDVESQAKPSSNTEKNEFFIYKKINQSPEELKKSLDRLAQDLNESSFADADLIETLKTARVVSATSSILFTGTPDSLSKVKALLPTIDTQTPNGIQTIGDTVFFVYKIKQTPAEELIQALKNFANQLGESDLADRELDKSLISVKWIKETNSLLFVGTQSTLQKVEPLVTKFDLGTIPQTPPTRETPATFFVYTPQYQTGSTLITILQEFMQNLIHSGVSDSALFEAIKHLKFIEKTNSLIISGDNASIQQIQMLLTKFDISDEDTGVSIAAVDAANFLIYKLQYHSGVDIQVALKQVAASLTKTAHEANKTLIDAINSLQWVEITNSLLGTGTPEILTKVKELISSLDVPLRQVFIEVLVVETSLFNSQNFGLQWGSQFQYLNKTIGAMGNFPTTMTNNLNNSNQPPGTINFSNPLSYTTNLNTPVQGNSGVSNTAVPFSTGFDLGVIGDIIFHKGQSFISLGSLLNALQVDNDATVIMNPKIITQDGRTSTIFVGQNIPFVGSFISNTASNTLTSSNIEYRDVGVNLEITPTLGTNNIITLEIKQDISEQTNNTTQVQGSQVTGIQTSHTTMNTRVHVPDQHFLVLSGMIQDTKIHFKSSIPCLGGLPVIGALFAENDRADTKSNVIIFLRPYIIDTIDDYERLTNAEEDLFRQQAGPQDLKEELDAGIEMIRNLNNE